MARIRTLKPEFWDSPGTAKASFRTRLLFMAMWNWADDYGVGDATPGRLINFAFPHDDIPVAEFPCMLSEVSESYDVVFFTFRKRPFYVIPSWDAHQRNERRAKIKVDLYHAADAAITAARRDIAEPPTNSTELPCNSTELQALEQGNRGTGEQGNRGTVVAAPNGAATKKRGTRLNPTWTPNPETINAMRTEHPDIDLKTEHAKFIDYWTSKTGKDATKLDWDATWRNWIRNARPRPNTTTTERKANEYLRLATQLDTTNTTPALEAYP